jgi:hypothetical protein
MSGGFNNPIVGGGGALVYPSIHSPNFSAGPPVTGWSINKDGSFSFGSGGTITGTLKIFNSHGAVIFEIEPSKDAWFLYADTGSAVQGALLISGASASGTDDFGNPFDAGLATYQTLAAPSGSIGNWVIDLGTTPQPFTGTPLVGIQFQNKTHPFSLPPSIVAAGGNGAGTGSELELSSGKRLAGGQQSAVIFQDSEISGATGGFVQFSAGEFQVLIDNGGVYSSAIFVTPSLITLGLPLQATAGTASSPTLITTDTWNNFALVNGWANVGGAARYKLLAENRVAVSINISSAAATAFKFSSVSGIYVPSRDAFIAAGATANVASGLAPFVEIDTAGNATMNGLHAFSTPGGWVCMGSYELD